MSSRLTNILTILTFVVHAVVGCCLHHAHATNHHQNSEQTRSCRCSHPEPAADAGSRDSEEHEPAGCDDNQCWLIADRADEISVSQIFGVSYCLPREIPSDLNVAETPARQRVLSQILEHSLTPPQFCARLGIWLI